MSAELRSTQEGRTMVLTLHNPEWRNALEPEWFAAGIEALGVAESSRDVGCVVIAGEGGTFSCGVAAQRLHAMRQKPHDEQSRQLQSLHDWVEAVHGFSKPVIAAVEGDALGAGMALALACDLVVAARNASFGVPGVRMGLSPEAGADWALAQSLPRQLVAELLMDGGRIDAQRLHALGIVNRLCDAGQALAAALAWAQRLAEGRAPCAIASVKELLLQARGHTLQAHLAQAHAHFLRNLRAPEAGIGMAAHLAGQPDGHAHAHSDEPPPASGS